MPYTRGHFALTPPSLAIMGVSLVLAVAAMLVRYAGVSIPILNAARVFDVLALGYAVLLAGVLLRRL